MAPLNNSTLEVTDPMSYHCKVWSYFAGHSLLLIRTYEDDFLTGHTFYLVFEGVAYFEGPMTWQGVGYSLGTREECLEILQKAGGSSDKDVPDEALLRQYRLFKFKSPHGEIKILAGDVQKTGSIPGWFSWLKE
jgi:hypothetical protein